MTTDEQPGRRLAAILALDVVGYSALMHDDELLTLRRVEHLAQNIAMPVAAKWRGRVFKLIGDGILAEFAGVSDAFDAACEMIVTLDKEDPALEVRIGLHVGDVIHRGDDIYGDGVNVAARLEGFATPRCIALSDRAWADIRRRGVDAAAQGLQQLKNIAVPVQVFVHDPMGQGRATSPRAAQTKSSKRRKALASVAVAVALLVGTGAVLRLGFYPKPSIESVAQEGIERLPCSWLTIDRVTEGSAAPVISVTGGSLMTPEMIGSTLTRTIVEKTKQDARVDTHLIRVIPKAFCPFVEKFAKFRYAGVPRIMVNRIYLLGNAQKKSFTRVEIKIFLKEFGNGSWMFGIDDSGGLDTIGSMDDLRRAGKLNSDGSVSLMADSNDAPDWVAILIIDSNSKIVPKTIKNPDRSAEAMMSLEKMATDGHWNVEMIWTELHKTNGVAQLRN